MEAIAPHQSLQGINLYARDDNDDLQYRIVVAKDQVACFDSNNNMLWKNLPANKSTILQKNVNTGSVDVAANTTQDITVVVENVPSGYSVVGILSVSLNTSFLNIIGWYIQSGVVHIKVRNSQSTSVHSDGIIVSVMMLQNS